MGNVPELHQAVIAPGAQRSSVGGERHTTYTTEISGEGGHLTLRRNVPQPDAFVEAPGRQELAIG